MVTKRINNLDSKPDKHRKYTTIVASKLSKQFLLSCNNVLAEKALNPSTSR